MQTNFAIALFLVTTVTPFLVAATLPCDDVVASNRVVEELKKSCTEGHYCHADGFSGPTPAVAMAKCTEATHKYGSCLSHLKCEGKVVYCSERGYAGPTAVASTECIPTGAKTSPSPK